jgi:hypothetical protein
MVKKCSMWAFVAFILLWVATSAHAFNGERKGFILGFGLGPGFTSYTEKITEEYGGVKQSIERDRKSKLGLVTDFKIGYAPSNFLEIYWFSKVSWFGHKFVQSYDFYDYYYEYVYHYEYVEDWMVANGVAGIGGTYYFRPTAPSWFLSGGLGYSAWSVPFEDNSLNDYFYEEDNFLQDSRLGLGLFVGGGYEFARHLNVQMDLCWGKPKNSEGRLEVSSNALTVKCTLNALAY